MFTHKIETIISNGVATTGGKYLIPRGIFIASWYWNDDEGQLNSKKLNNVIYFTEPPVNILSAWPLV